MSETYLPIKDSLGYKNVKTALLNVFGVDLDTMAIHVGENENFGFLLDYKNQEVTIWITSTGKNKQFEYGEGGKLVISMDNPKFPKHSFLERVTLESLLKNPKNVEAVNFAFGRYEQRLELALKILKDYLDENNENYSME